MAPVESMLSTILVAVPAFMRVEPLRISGPTIGAIVNSARALIAASPIAFTTLRIAGGLYLIWIGIQTLRNARAFGATQVANTPTDTPGRLFVKGLVANAINPKVILFFLAFLPQFVDSQRGHVAWQIAQLGALFTVETVVIFGAIGWYAGSLGERLARRPAIGAWLDRLAGGIFVALGLRLAAVI